MTSNRLFACVARRRLAAARRACRRRLAGRRRRSAATARRVARSRRRRPDRHRRPPAPPARRRPRLPRRAPAAPAAPAVPTLPAPTKAIVPVAASSVAAKPDQWVGEYVAMTGIVDAVARQAGLHGGSGQDQERQRRARPRPPDERSGRRQHLRHGDRAADEVRPGRSRRQVEGARRHRAAAPTPRPSTRASRWCWPHRSSTTACSTWRASSRRR